MIWLAGLATLATISCSSDAATPTAPVASVIPATAITPSAATVQPPAPTATPSPAGSTPAPRVGQTATQEPVPTPAEPIVNLATLTVPVCRTTSFSPNGAGFGTVPHATPTPVPDSGSSGQPSSDGSTAFVAGMRPLYDTLGSAISAGDGSWSEAVSAQSRAGSIAFEGRRLSHICSALSIIPRTTASDPLFSQLASSLEARRDALFAAAELLRISGADFSDHEAERQRTTSDILSFGSVLNVFAETSGVPDTAGFRGYTIVNPLLELQVDVAPGWVTVRNGIDVFINAPPGMQRYSVSGLGPDAWKLGTALRIRRFRNESGRTLKQAVAVMDSLLVRFGSRTAEFETEIGGERGVRLTYSYNDGYWQTIVGATVVADATYLFELGCPVEFLDECESALDAILESVKFDAT